MIKTLLFDIDMTITGNKIYQWNGYPKGGVVISKSFSDHVWTALKMFKVKGINVVAISGDEWNRRIMKERKIDFYSSKQEDGTLRKELLLPELKLKYGDDLDDYCFIADDLFDFLMMKQIPNSYCPNNSNPFIKEFLDIRYYEEMTGEELTKDDYSDPDVLAILDQNPYILDSDANDGCLMELYHSLFGDEKLTDDDIEKLILLDAQEKMS